MLDLRVIREKTDEVRENLRRREADVDLDAIIALDEARRSVQSRLDDLRHQRNELAKSMKGRKPTDEERARGRELKEQEPALEEKLALVPNLVRPDVPAGSSEEQNEEVRRWGEPPRFDFEPRDHLGLGELHGLFDFEAGAKVTGQKFYFLRDEAVFLELGLIRYAVDRAVARGFSVFQTPDMARREVCKGTGFNPVGPERQTYTIEDEDLVVAGPDRDDLG